VSRRNRITINFVRWSIAKAIAEDHKSVILRRKLRRRRAGEIVIARDGGGVIETGTCKEAAK
jgi:hypothetical protein